MGLGRKARVAEGEWSPAPFLTCNNYDQIDRKLIGLLVGWGEK